MSLGVYPKISLKNERDKTLETKKLLENNINPISEKKLNKIFVQFIFLILRKVSTI
jgi:hypothetical protein